MLPNPLRHLFTPTRIGAWALAHRIVYSDGVAQTCRLRPQDESALRFYAARCTPGGLLICSLSPVHDRAGSLPVVASLQSASQVNSWRDVIAEVHARGGIAIARIGDLPNMHRRLPNLDEIDAQMQGYRAASENAGDAGFDGVELLAIRGTLPERFLMAMPASRPLEDDASDSDFLLGALQTIAAVWPADRIGISMNIPLPLLQTTPRFSGWREAAGSMRIAYTHFISDGDLRTPLEIDSGPTNPLMTLSGSRIMTHAWAARLADEAIGSGQIDAVSPLGDFEEHADLPARWRNPCAFDLTDG